jgi:hypothetical protein
MKATEERAAADLYHLAACIREGMHRDQSRGRDQLFEVKTSIHAGPPLASQASCTIWVTACRRCLPLEIRLAPEMVERFEITRAAVGVEPCPLPEDAAEALPLFNETRGPVLAECGMDFCLDITNTTDEPQHFEAQVWGWWLDNAGRVTDD